MSDDSISRTLSVTLAVCFVCAILVASAAVSLRNLQEKNKAADKIKNILQAGQLYEHDKNVLDIYTKKIEPILIELATGRQVPEKSFTELLNPDTFDIKTISRHTSLGESVPSATDIAGIKQRPKYMVVYLVKKNNHTDKIILPFYGKGLWSTIYGFLALSSDMKTITGITFYQHGETPGLGGEIDNPHWKASWQGKAAFNENGEVIISIIKGHVLPNRPESNHQIDGLSGATLTGRGVDRMIRYWLGKEGYGPFLNKLRTGGRNEKA